MYPPGDDGPRPPIHTPIPLNVDKRIDLWAVKLADCRGDLSPKERHKLARLLAYRTRTYQPTKK